VSPAQAFHAIASAKIIEPTCTRTSIGPGGNPAGTVYGSLNYCAKTYAQGSVYNSYTDASMQTCDYTNTGSGCSSFTYEAFPGGHILSPGNVYSPGSSFADGTINWYDGTGYNSTPFY